MRHDSFISLLINLEGGYTNNKKDLGGRTTYGITEKVAKEAGYQGNMKYISRDFAHSVYKKKYYDPMRVAMIKNDELAYMVFDWGVNAGNGRSIKTLQESVNMLCDGSPLEVDGIIGPATLEMVGNVNQGRLLRVFEANREARYVEITKAREANEEFLYGWLKRIDKIKRYFRSAA